MILVLIMMALLIAGCGGSSNGDKKVAELVGNWCSVQKDSKGDLVSNIIILNIKDGKNAHFTSWDLTGNKFSKNDDTMVKILWKYTEMDLAIECSGNTLKFTTPEAKELGTILECKYDADKKQLVIKDSERSGTFTRDDLKIEDVKAENIAKFKDYLAKEGKNVDIEKDMSDSEYMQFVRKNTFGR